MYAITGASSGLGLALAKLLAKKGRQVVSLSRRAPQAKGVAHIMCDLNSEGSINAAAAELLASNEPLAALVHCAGVYTEQPLESLTGQGLASVFTTNIIGPELLTSRLLKRVIADKADIMNVSSIMALRGDIWAPAYTSSKWALNGFTEVLRTRLKDTPCRVILVCPNGMNTPIFKTNNVDADSAGFMDPADIAAFMLRILELPKDIEVSQVVIDQKRP